jgi:hypothetical protein
VKREGVGMGVQLISIEGTIVKMEVTIELSRSMLTSEENIQQSLNEVGCMATVAALKYLDTDGSAIEIAGEVMRTKGEQPKAYQTPYGEVVVNRHVYQRSGGGKTYCPLEREGRIIITSTPLFAKQVSSKLAYGSARDVQRDLGENHHRPVAVSYIQRISEAVASIIEAKEESWNYVPPKMDVEINSVAIGLDGTCMLLCESGWREAMVGTVSLYDAEGERQHTIYIGATPEYGKAQFLERLEREIQRTKARYPQATYVGVADGAASNWQFLTRHTSEQVLDFYHATGYLGAVAVALYPKDLSQQKQWLDQSCHALKHDNGTATQLYQQMLQLSQSQQHPKAIQDNLAAAVTYFHNHIHQMNYALYGEKHYPIGSGVTEAACKTVIKQRLCCSGMRWKETGAAVVLSLRTLVLTPTRWCQFWNKLNQYGFPISLY